MAKQLGKSMLLKRGDAASPEVFTTVAGLRPTNISLNKGTIDITNKDSANMWRETLAGGGVKSASFGGGGVFSDAAGDENIRSDFFGSVLHNYQVIVPSFGTFTGAFAITSLEYTGEHEDAVGFSITLESAGELVFASV